jgi:hypothetical protein
MGTPRQAIAYITGSRDERRDAGLSSKELEYVAQMGAEWRAREAIVFTSRPPVGAGGSALAYMGRYEDGPKRDFEGGRVPLVGFGTLAGHWPDERELATRFQLECYPWQMPRGKAGYKSFTLTLPKEVSLLAEGHRQSAKELMCDAAAAMLEEAFCGLDLSAVGAIHTRNEAGEVHFHMHLLVAKFARAQATNRMVSVNSKAGGNTGHRIWDIKRAWKVHVDRLLRERLGVEVEQGSGHGPVALRLGDGTRLGALNQDSRRVLEKMIVAGEPERRRPSGVDPGAGLPTASGERSGGRRIKIGIMDDRIYEVASGRNGRSGWDVAAFVELFPEQAKFAGRYAKRVLTLKEAGYLTDDGRITPDFQIHYGLRRGVVSPQLQGVRADLRRQAERESEEFRVAARIATVEEALQWNDRMRTRLERLGHSCEEIRRSEDDLRARMPTRDRLEQLRAGRQRRMAVASTPHPLPTSTKGLVRAFVDVQTARVRWALAISADLVTLSASRKKEIAESMLRAAEVRLIRAREESLARAGLRLRSWFWAIRVVIPHDVRRLEIAIDRCARLARSEEVQRLYRNAVREDHHGRGEAQVDPRLKTFEGVAFAFEVASNEASLPRSGLGRGVAAEVLPPVPSPRSGHKSIPTAPSGNSAIAASRHDAEMVRQAERVSWLLEEEGRQRRSLILPAVFEQDRAALERVSARLAAFGLASPFTTEVVVGVAPLEIRRALEDFRQAGLLVDSASWAHEERAARDLAGRHSKGFRRRLEQDLDR